MVPAPGPPPERPPRTRPATGPPPPAAPPGVSPPAPEGTKASGPPVQAWFPADGKGARKPRGSGSTANQGGDEDFQLSDAATIQTMRDKGYHTAADKAQQRLDSAGSVNEEAHGSVDERVRQAEAEAEAAAAAAAAASAAAAAVQLKAHRELERQLVQLQESKVSFLPSLCLYLSVSLSLSLFFSFVRCASTLAASAGGGN